MTYPEIAATIILPAIISFIVSYFNSGRQKRLDFTFDYRRYILEERKMAYKELQTIDAKYRNTINFLNETNPSIRPGDLSQQLHIIVNTSFWISENMKSALRKMSGALGQIQHAFDDGNVSKVAELLTECRDLNRNIIAAIFQDLIILDDIDAFRNEKYGAPIRSNWFSRLFS